MVIVWILQWWYSTGWLRQVEQARRRMAGLYDYFSIDILVQTLFAPFRQISAGSVDGSLPVKLRALLDNIVSRCIGFVVRTLVIVIGVVALMLVATISGVMLVVWFFLPIMWVPGVVLMAARWMPWA